MYEKKRVGKIMKKKIRGETSKKNFWEDNVEIFSGRTMSEIFSGRTMSEKFSGRTMSENFSGRTTSKICSGRTTSEICSGRTMSVNCLGRTMSKNAQGGQCPKMLREDNVLREVMSILFRESNINKRSGNPKTREANG